MNIRIPPPIQTLIAGLLMFGLDTVVPIKAYASGLAVNLVLVALLMSSVFFLMPAVLSFWRNKTTVNPIKPEKATTLVVDGVFRYSRNPMYVGMALILFAWAVYLANPLNVVLLFLYVYVMTLIQIKPEERALVGLFGQQYQDYCGRVRRWI